MSNIPILADRISAMRWGLVAEAILQCPGAKVLARDIATENLADEISRLEPEVVILGSLESLRRGPDFTEQLARPGSVRRIISLFEDGRSGQLSEWQLSTSSVSDLSIASLCAAIAGKGSDG